MMGAPGHTEDSVRARRQAGRFPDRASQTVTRLTLFTAADIQHAGAQAVPGGDAEACVSWIHGQVGEHRAGGAEAVPGEPLHGHVLLVLSVQRPGTKSQMLVNLCRHKNKSCQADRCVGIKRECCA